MFSTHKLLPALFLAALCGCDTPENGADAYGHFEAEEIMVSAERAGPILELDIKEGDPLEAGQRVGLIDTLSLHLQREEMRASLSALNLKTQDPTSRIEVLREQRKNLEREVERTRALVAGNAATARQLDDLSGQIDVIDREMASLRTQSGLANQGILGEKKPLLARLEQIEDQIRRCVIRNPREGTVILQLAYEGEMASPGKPLYKLADLGSMTLRVYVTGAQLPALRIGQEVEVQADQDGDRNRSLRGTVSWIAREAEFTPKSIQTKEERVNQVYAVKISVPNDGRLKIGMPGELHLGERALASDSE